MWRNDGGGIRLLGEDLGLGLGWKLQAGSIRPVWLNGAIHHFVYSDSTGAEYRLDQSSNNVWTSIDGSYAAYDASAGILHFTDGSFWDMYVTSAANEADAGTLYATQMEDTNGNFLS
jgi:hypothetical protein